VSDAVGSGIGSVLVSVNLGIELDEASEPAGGDGAETEATEDEAEMD
jgi:hypothetical protein